MDWFAKRHVAALLEDESFIKEVAEAILADSTPEELVRQVAEHLGGVLDHDPRFQKHMAKAFLSDPARKREALLQLAEVVA